MMENERMRAENERLRNEVAVHAERQRQSQMKIADLNHKITEMAMESAHYTEWDWMTVHFWIMNIENGRFKKYDAVLKAVLSKFGMKGGDLESVNLLMLKMWGIHDGKEAGALLDQIQKLIWF